MKHKHSERLISTGRWILTAEGQSMMERVLKNQHKKKSKKKNRH